MVRLLGLMPRPRLETAVASVGPRQAPMRRAAPTLSPVRTPMRVMRAAVMATRTVALRMMPRRLRRMRLRETDSDSQYRRIGRKIVSTTVLGRDISSPTGSSATPTPATMRSTGAMRRNLLAIA